MNKKIRYARLVLSLLITCTAFSLSHEVMAVDPPPLFECRGHYGYQRPLLPRTWISAALLEDYTADEFRVGILEMSHTVTTDGGASFAALRATIYDGESDEQGLVDDKLYLFNRGNHDPSSVGETSVYDIHTHSNGDVVACYYAGSIDKPLPSYDIVGEGYLMEGQSAPVDGFSSSEHQCVGEAIIGATAGEGVAAQWWKRKGKNLEGHQTPADWFWFDIRQIGYGHQHHGKLWRTMQHSSYSSGYAFWDHYSTIYYPKFQNHQHNGLETVISACLAEDANRFPVSIPTSTKRRELKQWLEDTVDAPEDPALPAWPELIGIATYFVPVNYATPTFPATVFYESVFGPPRMNSRLFSHDGTTAMGDARLLGDAGYKIGVDNEGNPNSCTNYHLPGAIERNWGELAPCRARARLNATDELGFDEVVNIFTCPIDTRWFWMWYTEADNYPVTFMEANADITIGTGLGLADYTHIQTNVFAPPDQLRIPDICPTTVTTPTVYPVGCNTCHNPTLENPLNGNMDGTLH